MAGRRSKDQDDFFAAPPVAPDFEVPAKDDPFAEPEPVKAEPVEAVPVVAEAAPQAVAPPPAPVDPAAPPTPKPAKAPEDWSDVEVIPRYLHPGHATEMLVQPKGVRGIMVVTGVLLTTNEHGQSSRIAAGGYVFFAAGTPHQLAVEGPHAVRAVFVQSVGYDAELVPFVPADLGPRAPVAHEGPSWTQAPSTIRVAGDALTLPNAPAPMSGAPVARAHVSRAQEQHAAMMAMRGRKGRVVRHPNEVVPVPTAQPMVTGGAPQPIQDQPARSIRGEGLV